MIVPSNEIVFGINFTTIFVKLLDLDIEISDLNRLLKDDNTTIVAFTLVIEDANYKYDKKGNLQCVQARNIKELLRKDFSKKVENYFLDNIIHLADNPQESEILKKVFNKYQKYAIKG